MDWRLHFTIFQKWSTFAIQLKFGSTETQKNNWRWKIAQAFEIRWWRHYLRKQSKEDYLEWKRKYWQNFLVNNAIEPLPGQTILDVGCGPAGVYMLLDQQKVAAVDPLLSRYSADLVHFDQKAYPWVNFHPLAFEDYVLEQQFDKVFCLNAINHVADIEFCFDHLVAACRSGGELIVSIDAHNHEIFKKLFRWIPGDILHPHQYDLAEYEKMLTDRGCSLIRTKLYKEEFFFNYYVLIAVKSSENK